MNLPHFLAAFVQFLSWPNLMDGRHGFHEFSRMKTDGAAGLRCSFRVSLLADPIPAFTGETPVPLIYTTIYYSHQFMFIREIRVSHRLLRLHHFDRSGMTTIFSDPGSGRAAS